jgi:hypothetical protein
MVPSCDVAAVRRCRRDGRCLHVEIELVEASLCDDALRCASIEDAAPPT